MDYMSLKEIDLLIDLYNYEEKNSKPNHEEWYDFKVLASKKYKISDDEVVSMLMRINTATQQFEYACCPIQTKTLKIRSCELIKETDTNNFSTIRNKTVALLTRKDR